MNEKYIQSLRDAIQRMHGCASRYISTVAVKEELKGETVWEGKVEVFDLAGLRRRGSVMRGGIRMMWGGGSMWRR